MLRVNGLGTVVDSGGRPGLFLLDKSISVFPLFTVFTVFLSIPYSLCLAGSGLNIPAFLLAFEGR
jgi:hypothetical protein